MGIYKFDEDKVQCAFTFKISRNALNFEKIVKPRL